MCLDVPQCGTCVGNFTADDCNSLSDETAKSLELLHSDKGNEISSTRYARKIEQTPERIFREAKPSGNFMRYVAAASDK